MKIGIVGNGTVGRATARAFIGYGDHEVRTFDTQRHRSTHSLDDVAAGCVLDCDMVFVCLPTPAKPDGSCDTSALDCFFAERQGGRFRDAFYVVRSTVPVRWARNAAKEFGLPHLLHWPEFLTARCAETDAKIPARHVIGSVEKASRSPAVSRLVTLVRERWPGVPCFATTTEASAFVKLMQNAHSAVKVAFFNEMRTLADAEGIEWEPAVRALLAGGWIEPMHTQVPGPDGKRGFGGACLPKDLANLAHCFRAADVWSPVIDAAMCRNATVDRKE